MDEIKLTFEGAEPTKEDTCKGLVFRGYRSTFHHNGRIETRQGVNLLKRKSCPGCERCEWMMDNINEAIDTPYLIIPAIKDGELYTLRVTNISKDWETGYVDSYDLEITPLNEG